jgi:hypothetical protein
MENLSNYVLAPAELAGSLPNYEVDYSWGQAGSALKAALGVISEGKKPDAPTHETNPTDSNANPGLKVWIDDVREKARQLLQG